jgi:Ead/Ea22-like protein
MTACMSDAPMTPAHLSELKRVAEEATPGPWFRTMTPFGYAVENVTKAACMFDDNGAPRAFTNLSETDATFIATFNPATVLQLLARLDEVERVAEAALVERLKRLADRAWENADKAPTATQRTAHADMAAFYDEAATALARLDEVERERDEANRQRGLLADRALAEHQRALAAEAQVERLKAALDWISPPFVDDNTTTDELWKRVKFAVEDAARSTLLSVGRHEPD